MDVHLKLLPHQIKLMRSAATKALLLCGRGAGKSFICAVLALLTLLQGKNVMIGGQRFDTLHDTLYAEIKRMAQAWGIYDRIQWHESPMMMDFGDAHCYFGTYQSPDMARGYSRVSLMILDELFLAPLDILAIWTPVMRDTGGPTRIVGATTPRPGSMWNVTFSDPDCDWEIIRATTRDNTFISEDEFNLFASTIHNDEQYRSEILGELITDLGASAIIHIDEFPKVVPPTSDTRVLAGLDCGEGVERDATAFFARRGNKVLDAWEANGISHEETVTRILKFNKEYPITLLRMDMAFSDYEFGVLQYHLPCEQINFGSRSTDPERYANIRAEMFFNAAHTIKEGLCVDGFGELSAKIKRQFCAIGWKHNNLGKLLITPKEDLRLVLGSSTDIADALSLTCLDRWTGDNPNYGKNIGLSKSDIAKILRDE